MVRPSSGFSSTLGPSQKTASGRSSTGQPRCCWTRFPQPRRQATRRSSSTCSSSASASSTSSTSSHPVSSSPPWPSSSTSFLPRERHPGLCGDLQPHCPRPAPADSLLTVDSSSFRNRKITS